MGAHRSTDDSRNLNGKDREYSPRHAAKQTKQRPDNATMLKLYSHYKQATEGDVAGEKPGFTEFVNRAKYEAWAKLKGTRSDEAMQKYIDLVKKLGG